MQVRLNSNKVLARHDDASARKADEAFTHLEQSLSALGKLNFSDENRRRFEGARER